MSKFNLALMAACFISVLFVSAFAQPNGFTIQIASRESQAEAEALVAELSQSKLKADISSFEIPRRGQVFRIRVGRFPSINAARLEAEKLIASKIISSYWVTKVSTDSKTTVQSAAVTAPVDTTRSRYVTKSKPLPDLSLGEFINALSDRWSVRVPDSLGVYTASVINPKTRTIRPAVVMMDEARMRQLAAPAIKRPELLLPIEMRFEPGVKNSPANSGMSFKQSEKLTQSLKAISGFQDLSFDDRGYLVLGQRISGGSELARLLLRTAVESNEVFEIEGAEGSDAVAFGAFFSAQFSNAERGSIAYNRIQLDFNDFTELRGDDKLLESFDAGFVFLHELAHGVWELPDEGRGGLGECETFINQIRRQLGLPERVRYHYHIRGQANGGEQGELQFFGLDNQGNRRSYKLMWDNRAVNREVRPANNNANLPATKKQ